MKEILIKRIYEDISDCSGYCILVDRVWPRGVSKSKAGIDEWIKELAPSDNLRKWFNHDPDKFVSFERKYRLELKNKEQRLEEIRKKALNQRIILLYGAKDLENNQAVVLKKVLTE